MRIICVILVILLLYLTGGSALASHRHEHHTSIVTVDTAAGVIRVAADYATRFKNLIADFVKAGYNPGHVGCFATSGHVRNSRHYLGQACDFDQGARPHSAFMRSTKADTIIHKYGFTNGCSFGDCGHVGTDNIGRRHAGARYAHHHYRYHKHRAKIASAPPAAVRASLDSLWNKPAGQAHYRAAAQHPHPLTTLGRRSFGETHA